MNSQKEISFIIRELRGDLSLREFAQKCDVSHTTIDNLEKGIDFRTGKPTQVKTITLQKIAAACNVSLSYILGETESKVPEWVTESHDEEDINQLELLEYYETIPSNQQAQAVKKFKAMPLDTPNISAIYPPNIHMLPVYESVSAGFGAMASDCVVDYYPAPLASQTEAKESLYIRVKGESMYPKIENGDLVLVHKQESVDSGSLAVVLVDGDEGYVKKVMYGPDWIELISINPMYPPMRFEKSDILRVRVVGLVRQIIKEA